MQSVDLTIQEVEDVAFYVLRKDFDYYSEEDFISQYSDMEDLFMNMYSMDFKDFKIILDILISSIRVGKVTGSEIIYKGFADDDKKVWLAKEIYLPDHKKITI